MVTVGDSCSEGCGFESLHRIPDGHIFTFICCKIVMFFFCKIFLLISNIILQIKFTYG